MTIQERRDKFKALEDKKPKKNLIFRRILHEGKPALEMTNNYLAPLVINKMVLVTTGVSEVGGYDANFIDMIIEKLNS